MFIAISLVLPVFFSLSAQQNSGIIKGRVYNATTNEGIPFATVQIWGTTSGAITDNEGNYTFTGVKPGYVEIRASSIGYKPYLSGAVMVTNSNHVFLDLPLEEADISLGEVVVKASPFTKKIEIPVSVRIIGIDEIERNPGGNRDISKVIQSFPGVASTPAFRNDVIVRGGGPNENRFYIDNIEIPYLNHFSTQGASGGPIGILNVDFVQSVDFISGAFPASKGNALSSVLNFTFVDGNREHMKYRLTLGASDLGITADGPAGERSSFLVSLRRSYLQFLFSALDLPFLPAYTDFQYKYRFRIDEKNELIFLGLGAKDDFSLNLKANETEYQRYLLDYIPVQEQYSYMTGVVYKHYRSNGYDTWVLSRNYLNNSQYKYRDNIETEGNKILDYLSGEGETKARYERIITSAGGFRVNYGAGYEYAHYRNSTYRLLFSNGAESALDYDTNLKFGKYSIFGQLSRSFLDQRLSLSMGLRTDMASYSASMKNPLNQVSPRLSASFALSQKFNLNFNTGRFYQLPPYTALGYADASGRYVNRDNNLKYIRADHFVTGLEYLPVENIQFSMEGFLKSYRNYPFSVRDGVPLSSKSADYGIFGDEELLSKSEGRAYGVELLGRLREFRGTNLVFSYTYVRSEFRGSSGEWIPSSWDNRHLFNLTATKNLGRNWELGVKWRFVGGAPYTPFDLDRSSLKAAWDLQGRGYPDYTRFNTERLKSFHQLDIRIDKQYFFKGWSLMFYADVQNVYNHKADQPSILVRDTDGTGVPLSDPADPSRYLLKFLESESGTILPTVGIIIDL